METWESWVGGKLRIDIEAEVMTSGGQRAGKVDRVIINPRTKRVSHIVVHRGALLTRDIVVPVEAIAASTEGRVTLNTTSTELEQMPDFAEEEYVVPPQAAPTGPYIPGSVLWPVGYVYTPTVIEEERHVPEGSIEITEGTEVKCLDGNVGTVDEVLVDSATGQITSLIIRAGTSLNRDVTVPVSWVKRADAKVVELACAKEALARLGQRTKQ